MRCLACDRALSDFESTRKSASGHYIDLCNHCFYSGTDKLMQVTEREDLRGTQDNTETDIEIEEDTSWD